jgi:hypothetical protein
LKLRQNIFDRAASGGCVTRLVRFSSFFWGRLVGVVRTTDEGKKHLGKFVCLLSVWVCVAMPVLGSDIVPNQSIRGGEEGLAVPWQAKTVETPNCIHKIEIHWVEDTEGVGVRVVQILTDSEEHSAQPGSGLLASVPQSDQPSRSDAYHSSDKAAENHVEVWHWWRWLFYVIAGLLVVAILPVVGVPLLCEVWNIWGELIRSWKRNS